MDIAVIGSGMAGLATARILKDAGHNITIFEALTGRGMDSHSTEFEGGLIDAPLRVMNPHLWKNTLSLATYLGIKTYPVRTYMACSWLFEDRTETWLTTTRSRIGNFPIIKSEYKGFVKDTREHVYKLQVAANRDHLKTAGARDYQTGQLKSKPHPYEPLEKE